MASRFQKVKPLIVTLFDDKDDLKASFMEAGIEVQTLHLNRSNKLWFWHGKQRLEKLLKDLNPAIVHAHLYKSEIIARISNLNGAKLLGAFVNDSYAVERYKHQSRLRNVKLNTVRFFDKSTINKCDGITSITETIAASNCKALSYPRERVAIIYRGRSIAAFNPKQPIMGDRFIFLVVGRLLVRKGYLELIEAIDQLKSTTNQPFLVRIAGDGADAVFIRSRAANLVHQGYIEFLGNVTDIPQQMSEAHSFVFPSHYEGQGGALVEAMLSAKPIIASDIAVFKEQVEDGVSAKLFEMGNAQDLAKQMEWMMHHLDRGRKLGEKARAYSEEHFDIEKVAGQMERFYLGLLR